MGSNAFIDNGLSPGKEFCSQFLSSPEFTVDTLRKINCSGSSKRRKHEIVQHIAEAFEENKLSAIEILLPYIHQSRRWLSFKLGQANTKPQKNNPELLLKEFGEDGWYGPLEDSQNSNFYYIRTSKITDYSGRKIRWNVVAEISSEYIAFFWNGFTLIPATDDNAERQMQFLFWKYIPQYFEEISRFCDAQLHEPNLHKLILHDMWDRYIHNNRYQWHHLRIRAESGGVALNAHSSEIKEINVQGLKALSCKLAESILEAVGITDNERKSLGEIAGLLILIKEWGTKSYEFSLVQVDNTQHLSNQDLRKNTKSNKLLKVHCYFGLRPDSKTQDSLQHLKCDCSGSTNVLKFLLEELKSYGDGNT